MTTLIETERLILRTWKKEDADPYFKINQDPKVIEHLPSSLTIDQVNDFIDRKNIHQEKYRYSLWAVESKESSALMGFIGLNYTDWKSHFTPAVEVGWRLGSQYWGNGFATEGAQASLEYGFKTCGLKEIVAYTVPKNSRSIRVMEKISMKHDRNGDFTHPKLAADHPLSQHILYRLTADEYLQAEK